jgi:hypothetical protein
MPEESIYGGYLRTQQYEQQQEELAEEKKRKKLEEALNQLRIKQAGRQMERDVEEFRYQQRKRQELDEALKNLRLRGIDVDALITGYKAPEPPVTKEKEPWWVGTEFEELFKKTGGVEKTAGVLDITRAMEALYPTSEMFQEFGEPTTPADSLRAGLITKPRTEAEEPFFAGKKRLESILGEFRPPTDVDAIIDAQRKGGGLPTISDLMSPVEEESPKVPPGEILPPLMMGGREFPEEIPLETVTPSLFSPKFEQQKKEQALAEALKSFQVSQVPIDFEKTETALARLRKIPKEQALADLEENRIQHRKAGLDVDYLIRRIKTGK